ncbi:site-2 protease family protein [bacterium]|nr:MAG: site-2 protease family protein [bacterium]
MGNFDQISTPEFWMRMLVLVLSIGLHEYGHAKFADLAGDPTPRMMGRVTLNPIKHLDPLGTIFMFLSSLAGMGIGWGKPVMVRPDRMKNPRWDHLVSVVAGPAMNLLLAVVFALAFRILGPSAGEMGALFLLTGVLVNVGLMLFNLIPLGPLDGHWIVGAFLPEPQRVAWYQFNRGLGTMIFLLLILLPAQYDPISKLLGPVLFKIVFFLIGGSPA